MNHARITHLFSFLRRACVVWVICRWIERGPSLIVSGCASKAVCAWFWALNGSIFFRRTTVHRWAVFMSRCRSVCVEYAWLCAGHGSAVSAYASELVRNRARPRPSTDAPPSYHAWTAHVSRSFNWRLRSMRVWTRSVSDSCVGRATNVRGILHRICSYASTCKMSAIPQWL